MGRVKGRVTKVAAHRLVEANASIFGLDFTKNKAMLRKLGIMGQNPVELNRIAGEVTTLMKQRAPEAIAA